MNFIGIHLKKKNFIYRRRSAGKDQTFIGTSTLLEVAYHVHTQPFIVGKN